MHDLLTDAVIPIRAGDTPRTEHLALPDLYARLAGDTVDAFPGLGAHQAPAWYQFLGQLGALALRRQGRETPPSDPDAWRAMLADLARDTADSAWSLVVEDPAKPALLQAPTHRLAEFKPYAATPDALDLLVTAKNHDLKQSRAIGGSPHLWLYALVNLQTQQGYSGRGQPGVARMNGGFSSRVLVDRRPSPRWGQRVVRAIRMMLARREDVLESVDDQVYRSGGGLALTWLRSWDTDEMLSLSELDPYFIEVCRRVRLTEAGHGSLEARVRPAAKPRTDAKAFFGHVGDPWIPLDLRKDPPTALTVGGGGFDYRLVQRILFRHGESQKPFALGALPGESGRDSEIHFAALVRGQGKTEGFHERVISLPASVQLSLGADPDDEDEASLAQLSDEMVALAGSARKVLRQAITVYLQGPEHPNFQKTDAAPIVRQFDRQTDDQFFDSLFAAPADDFECTRRKWQVLLRTTATRLAENAWGRLSPPGARREKAQFASESVLFGGLRKQLPDAFEEADSRK